MVALVANVPIVEWPSLSYSLRTMTANCIDIAKSQSKYPLADFLRILEISKRACGSPPSSIVAEVGEASVRTVFSCSAPSIGCDVCGGSFVVSDRSSFGVFVMWSVRISVSMLIAS